MNSDRRRAGRAIRRARQHEARTRQGLALIAAGGIAAARAIEAMIGPLHDFQRAALGMTTSREVVSPAAEVKGEGRG